MTLIVSHTEGMKHQITVRGLDAETQNHLRDLARKKDASLNQILVMLIRKGAGLRSDDEGPETIGNSLDAFIGSWSPQQEKDLLHSIRDMDQVDEELWR
jgi:hypothetical protein